jgi:sensor histidine kinase regulating citrate/malate metabolism
MGFRGKQIVTLTLVAGVVALATSLMNTASLTRLAVSEAKDRLELLASTFYHQTSRVIRSRPGEDLREVLSTDPSLRAHAEAVVGYSPTTLYVAITDTDEVAILHSDPTREGKSLSSAEPVSAFLERNGFSQFWALGRGNRVLELELPFTVDEEPFGAVRVAISTLLLKEQLSGAITTNAILAASVVLVSFLASFYLANRLLAPIEMLRRELARIDPGGGEPPLELRNEADVSRITEFFAALSKKFAEDRQLRESGSSWLETMMRGLSDAVMVVSNEKKILTLNDPASQILGQSRGELQGRPLDEIIPPENPISTLVQEALARGEPVGPRSVSLDVHGRDVPHP